MSGQIPGELWVPIRDTEYKVSNHGRIKIPTGELEGDHNTISVIMKDSIANIVYQSFIGDIPEEHVVDHRDGDMSNNHIDNLCVIHVNKHGISKEVLEEIVHLSKLLRISKYKKIRGKNYSKEHQEIIVLYKKEFEQPYMKNMRNEERHRYTLAIVKAQLLGHIVSDIKDPTDEDILEWWDNLDRDQKLRIYTTMKNNKRRIPKKMWITHPPYGYDLDTITKELVINPAEAKVVKEMFRKRDKEKTLTQITEWLIENNKPTKRGGYWTATTVKKILENPVYYGKIRFRGSVVDGVHDPIILPRSPKRTNDL